MGNRTHTRVYLHDTCFPIFLYENQVTGGRDGCVRVWDPRVETPVVRIEPREGEVRSMGVDSTVLVVAPLGR